jgi:uncharacterized protein involved in exopolysaccharide biosynthesis
MATLSNLPEATTVLPVAGTHASGGASSFAVRSFLYAVFKHRGLVLGVFLLVFLCSALAAIIRPQTWMASSKVLVKLGETVQLAPSEAPSRSINPPLNQEVVKTEADLARSWEVVKAAVDQLGIEPEDGDDPAAMDELIDGLRSGLTVQATPGTNMLQISFIGRDPERSARFVNAITESYVDHHNKVYGRSGVKSFYDEQIRILDTEMKDAQGSLRDYLQEHNVVDIDTEVKLLTSDVVQQDKGLKAHRAKITATERKLAEVKAQLGKTPEQVPFAKEWLSNPTLNTYKGRLADLELERNDLLQRYMPDHRRVTDVEARIQGIRSRLQQEQDRVLGKETLRYNDLHYELQRNVFSLETLLSDARAREPAFRRRLESTRKRLENLRDRKFHIDNLQQIAEQKRYSYDLYWKKREEARVAEAMTDQSLVNVSIVERATAPLEPRSSLLLPLILGLVGGLGLAAMMAVAVEYLNRRLRFEEEVERYLELPVLAVIPDLETTPDLAKA